MHISVLDLGSNSFHLLEARVLDDRRIECITDRKHSVRLGEQAFVTGEIGAQHWQVGMRAVADLLAAARASSSSVVAVATSVFRDVRNGRDFLAEIQRELGLCVELLSEGSEAELSLRGALEALGPSARSRVERAVVVDLGGGSLELAVGRASHCTMKVSVPLGVLRLAATCLSADRVLRADSERAIVQLVEERLAESAQTIRALSPSPVLLSSGTARKVAKLAGAESVSPDLSRLSRAALAGLVDQLRDQTPASLIARGVPPARADTLPAGAVVLGAVLDLLDVQDALVTGTGLREGVVARAAERAAMPAALSAPAAQAPRAAVEVSALPAA